MHRHAIHFRTPEPTPCTHSCLPHSPTPIYTHTGPLPCLPHSITAHTHDRRMHTPMPMPLPIDASTSPTRYAPLSRHHAPHTPLTPLNPRPHTPLPLLPHSITAHMHDHHMPTPMAMPLPINALIAKPYTLLTPGPTRCTHVCLTHTPTPVPTQALS